MARSVAELLPRPFADLTVEDVASIIEAVGAPRETLFFERKAQVSGNSLAKSCAAFANTYGGLLVVGVGDDDDALVGIEPLAAEAQLWVKDTLRSLVLPMPPFRARWLPTADERGLLVVLVEESAATPHLLTRSGAIYVRNPGSSDPVPLSDQQRLIDLMRRGAQARANAEASAQSAVHFAIPGSSSREDAVWAIDTLAVAPTSVTAAFEERLFSNDTPEYLGIATWGENKNPEADYRVARWAPSFVGVDRLMRLRQRPSVRAEGVLVGRDGSVSIYWGFRGEDADPGWRDSLPVSHLEQRFAAGISTAREILAELGAHGDLRVAYRLHPHGREVIFPGINCELPETVVETWSSFDDETITARVFAEVARAAGVGPPKDDAS